MKNNITKIPRMCGMLRWQSPIFIIALAILFIIDSILNGEGMGDVVLCFAPFFSGLKDKLTKGLNILNEKLDQVDEEEDDEDDDEEDDDEEDDDEEDDEDGEEEDIEDVWKRRISEKYARGEKLTPREQFALELIQENEELRLTEEEKEERRKRWEAEIVAKYERGEELTPNEKKALELIMENEQIELEMQQREAEYEAKMAAEKEEKKKKRKEMISKVGKAIASIGANSSSVNGPATNNSQGGSSTQKKVAKVWTMKYVGPENKKAPNGFVNVPSTQQCYRPSHNELVEALKKMGYSSADINSIAGGPDSWWEPV